MIPLHAIPSAWQFSPVHWFSQFGSTGGRSGPAVPSLTLPVLIVTPAGATAGQRFDLLPHFRLLFKAIQPVLADATDAVQRPAESAAHRRQGVGVVAESDGPADGFLEVAAGRRKQRDRRDDRTVRLQGADEDGVRIELPQAEGGVERPLKFFSFRQPPQAAEEGFAFDFLRLHRKGDGRGQELRRLNADWVAVRRPR